jgi:hypothetical protein
MVLFSPTQDTNRLVLWVSYFRYVSNIKSNIRYCQNPTRDSATKYLDFVVVDQLHNVVQIAKDEPFSSGKRIIHKYIVTLMTKSLLVGKTIGHIVKAFIHCMTKVEIRHYKCLFDITWGA